jgi:hypothetical protein
MKLITDFKIRKYNDSTYVVVDEFTYSPYSDDVHRYYVDSGKGDGTVKRITVDTPIEDIINRKEWKVDIGATIFETMLFFNGYKKRVPVMDLLRYPHLWGGITAVAIVDRDMLNLIEEYEIALSVVPDFNMFERIKNEE